MLGNAVVVNFSGGETSPRSRGRFDQPWYQTSAKKMVNFIAELQGPARFRPGFVFCRQTRQGQRARLFDFHINDTLGYILEFTPGFMRAYDPIEEELLTVTPQIVIGVTQASTGVMSVASAVGFANGKELILSGIVGMPELNNRQVVIANLVGNSFNLTDPVTGAGINTLGFGAYASGGIASVVYELVTPYTSASDLDNLDGKSSEAVMYLVCPTQPPNKLTVDAAGNFTLGTYTRTNDPFAPPAATLTLAHIYRSGEVISTGPGTFLACPAGMTIVTLAAGQTPVKTAHYTLSGVLGTTQVNGSIYRIVPGTVLVNEGYTFPTTWNVLFLRTLANQDINSAAFTAYISGGIATGNSENPLAVAFVEGRLGFFGTNQRPDCFFLSKAPSSTTGNSRYDDFTGGSNADNACFFQLAPVGGDTSFISWACGGPDYLFIGTFGGPYRVSGSGLDIPITPSSINVRQFDTAGCEATPPAGLAQMFFIQRAGSTVRSIKVINPYLATFESSDLCLNAEQIGYSPLQRIALQRGRPDCLWATREDGTLCGMSVHITTQNADPLTGWHRHKLGGDGKALDLVVNQRQTGLDQLWVVTQRTVNGAVRCSVEVSADDVYFPDPSDFFTGDKDADKQAWQNVVWRLQERYVHLDSEASYDGSLRGSGAGATLTPSAVGVPQVAGEAPTTVTLTASAAVFKASDVGSEIWVKPNVDTGLGAGRALITAYTNSQQVTATVSVPFSSTDAVPAGDWYFAVSTFYGFAHLEGETVAVVGDGAVISDGGLSLDEGFPVIAVANGRLVLPAGYLGVPLRAAVLRAGLPYLGMLESHNLEMGGRTGPAQAKPRNIGEINARFMNTLGAEYGTDLYSMSRIEHRLSNAIADRPAPVFSGIKRLTMDDSWSGIDDATREKTVIILQRLPLPAVVQFLDVAYETVDEGAES